MQKNLGFHCIELKKVSFIIHSINIQLKQGTVTVRELLNTDNKKNKIYSNFKKTDAELTTLKKEYNLLHTLNNSLK